MNLKKGITVINRFSDLRISDHIKDEIPIFATQLYADFIFKTKGYCTIWFVYDIGTEAQYIIPFATLKKTIFRKGLFLTATIKIGEPDIKEQDFLENVVEYIKENKICDWISQPSNWAVFNTYPKKAIFCPFGTYKADLQGTLSDEELLLTFQPKCRASTRKAIRNGVEIKEGKSFLTDSFLLIKQTALRNNNGYPTLNDLRNEIELLSGNILIYVSYYNKQPQTTTILYSTAYCMYAIYAGSKPEAVNGANTLLYFKAFLDAKQRNVRYMDFVGARINPPKDSKFYRIQEFKSKFGTTFHSGYLWKMTISPIKFRLYKFILWIITLVNIRRHSRDIIDQEIERLS